MAVRGYVLVLAEVGRSRVIAEAIAKLNCPDTRILSVDVVTGPFDVIALLEATDLDVLANCVTEGIHRIDGVQRTTTCLTVSIP